MSKVQTTSSMQAITRLVVIHQCAAWMIQI